MKFSIFVYLYNKHNDKEKKRLQVQWLVEHTPINNSIV